MIRCESMNLFQNKINLMKVLGNCSRIKMKVRMVNSSTVGRLSRRESAVAEFGLNERSDKGQG